MEQTGIATVRVYLVEDETLLRESMRTMLELEPGILVAGEANDAEEALRHLKTLPIDVVLMDIRLPGMDGIKATRLLKEQHKNVTVVILTSYNGEYLGDAFEAGAAGYILKSSTRHQLVQSVRDAFEGQTTIDSTLAGGLLRELAELRKAQRESLLTSRQTEILRMVANGLKYREIANELFISESTVNRDMRHTFNSLGVDDAVHAVVEAYRKRLI